MEEAHELGLMLAEAPVLPRAVSGHIRGVLSRSIVPASNTAATCQGCFGEANKVVDRRK